MFCASQMVTRASCRACLPASAAASGSSNTLSSRSLSRARDAAMTRDEYDTIPVWTQGCECQPCLGDRPASNAWFYCGPTFKTIVLESVEQALEEIV